MIGKHLDDKNIQMTCCHLSDEVLIVNRHFSLSLQFSSIRGALVSTIVVSGHVGVVISFILGAYSEYISYPILAIAFTLLFDVLFFWFPETPVFLVKHNRIAVCALLLYPR